MILHDKLPACRSIVDTVRRSACIAAEWVQHFRIFARLGKQFFVGHVRRFFAGGFHFIGKFLAAFGMVTVAIGFTLPYAFFVKAYGPLDWGPAIGGYLGLLLMSGAYLAIGVMTSVWTRNQIVAFIVAVGLCFALWASGKLLQVTGPGLAPYLQAVSLDYHFQSIARGVIDTRDVLYYLTLTAISLVIAEASLASRRWR